MDNDICPGCIARQTPMPSHVLLFDCKQTEWELHTKRLEALGYEQIGWPREYTLMDHRTPRWATRWIRYDRPGDPWWDDSATVIHQVLDWLTTERAVPDSM